MYHIISVLSYYTYFPIPHEILFHKQHNSVVILSKFCWIPHVQFCSNFLTCSSAVYPFDRMKDKCPTPLILCRDKWKAGRIKRQPLLLKSKGRYGPNHNYCLIFHGHFRLTCSNTSLNIFIHTSGQGRPQYRVRSYTCMICKSLVVGGKVVAGNNINDIQAWIFTSYFLCWQCLDIRNIVTTFLASVLLDFIDVHSIKNLWLSAWITSGPCFNIKTVFPSYGDSHVKDKTVGETFLSLTWESLYW